MGQTAHRDARIAEIAAGQKRLVTLAQLRALGLSRQAVSARCGVGSLHRVHAAVFALDPPPHERLQLWLAAVLACGRGALLSDEPAALLQGILSSGSPWAQVSVPGDTGRRRRGFVVHRRTIDPRDIRRYDGIPCTSADRILVDLAPRLGEQELEAILVAADSLGFLKRHRLAELVVERRGRPGMPKLEALLALEPRIARSELELLFDPVWRGAGLARPLFNHVVAGMEVDVAWPELRMAVELDSQRFHGDWESAERDRERDQRLALAGWVCHRFVRRVVASDPIGTAERLRLLAALLPQPA